MSFLSDVWKYELNKLKNVGDAYKEDPERALLGINTPFESSVWGKVLGKDYEPIVDMYGGDTAFDQQSARARGIDPEAGHNMHNIARSITSVFAGGYGLGKAGMLGGSAGGGGAVPNSGMAFETAGSPTASSAPAWQRWMPKNAPQPPRFSQPYQSTYDPYQAPMPESPAKPYFDTAVQDSAQVDEGLDYWVSRAHELLRMATQVSGFEQ